MVMLLHTEGRAPHVPRMAGTTTFVQAIQRRLIFAETFDVREKLIGGEVAARQGDADDVLALHASL